MTAPPNMSIQASFHEALSAPEPLDALRRVAEASIDRGVTRDDLLATLEDLRRQLRAADRGDDEDRVLELMDMLAGWSAPHMKL